MKTYFIQSDCYVKIGQTHCVKKRLAQMQVGNPITLKLLKVSKIPEKLAHKKAFELSKHVHGEWFVLTPSLHEWIFTKAEDAFPKIIHSADSLSPDHKWINADQVSAIFSLPSDLVHTFADLEEITGIWVSETTRLFSHQSISHFMEIASKKEHENRRLKSYRKARKITDPNYYRVKTLSPDNLNAQSECHHST